MSIKETFDALLKALNEQNRSTLEELLAENFRFTGTVAQHRNKHERIKDILENPVFADLRFRNSDFLMLENTCLVFCEFQYPDQDRSLWFGRSTFIFSQIAGAWKLVAQHNSHIEA
ncbi:MAG: nuclear transport factor 2 family protein [Deinococcales bacterium]